jgi:hypothetical protein
MRTIVPLAGGGNITGMKNPVARGVVRILGLVACIVCVALSGQKPLGRVGPLALAGAIRLRPHALGCGTCDRPAAS